MRSPQRIAAMLAMGLLPGGLVGCGQDVAGKGGSELPGPLTVVVDIKQSSNGSTVLSGLQWRLWEQQDTVLLARAAATDSAGRLSIPNQSGTWVLEGWADSLPNRVPVSVPFKGGIPDSCVDSVSSTVSVNATHACAEIASPTKAGGVSVSRAPSRLTVVRLRDGLAPLRLRLTDSDGKYQIVPGTARLWTLADGDTLAFAGQLPVDGNGYLRMARPGRTGWYLLEVWPEALAGSGNVVARQPFSQGRFVEYLKCLEIPGVPTEDVPVTIHSCPNLAANPSVSATDTGKAASHWAAFEFIP